MSQHARVVDLRTSDEPEVVEAYLVSAKCGNCHQVGAVSIPKGTPINEAECPKCGCVRLVYFEEPSPTTKPSVVRSPWYDGRDNDLAERFRHAQEVFERELQNRPPQERPTQRRPMTFFPADHDPTLSNMYIQSRQSGKTLRGDMQMSAEEVRILREAYTRPAVERLDEGILAVLDISKLANAEM